MKRTPLNIGGIEISRFSRQEAIDYALSRFPHSSTRIYWIYANCVNIYCTDFQYRAAVNQAELILNDGAGIELAGHLFKRPVIENLCGTDWIPDFLTQLNRNPPQSLNVFLLGSRSDTLHLAESEFARRWPNINVVGSHHGFYDSPDVPLKLIQLIRPNVLLVAMGVPRQERFISENWEALTGAGVKIAIAGGAILDYLTGTAPRAPKWIRRLRLEWAYRTLKEPRRLWKRYLLGNVTFIFRLLKEYRRV